MTGIKTVLLLSLSIFVLVSGYQGERDQDAYLKNLLKRFLDRKEQHSLVDDLFTRWFGQLDVEIDSEIQRTYLNQVMGIKTLSWIICKIERNSQGKRVVIDSMAKGDYEEFVTDLKDSGEPRFAVYAVPEEWGLGDKRVFIFWLPDGTLVGTKMSYTGVVDKLKAELSGINLHLKITNDNESIEDKIWENLG